MASNVGSEDRNLVGAASAARGRIVAPGAIEMASKKYQECVSKVKTAAYVFSTIAVVGVGGIAGAKLVVGAAFAGLLLALDWRLFLFGWAVPVALTLWMSALDAYATHHWGYKNYKTADESRNLWWMALLFWGEGWHNNHHARPLDWSFRKKWWEIDIGAGVAWVISALSGQGLNAKRRVFAGEKRINRVTDDYV